MPAQSVSQVDPSRFFHLPSTGNAGIQRLDTRISGVSVSNDLSGRVSVTTAEGDKVTLSTNFAEDFRTVTYHGAAWQGGASVEVASQQTEYSSRRKLDVTVEGDLSEQEARELSKLFKKVLNIFRKLFNGQDEAAVAKTAKLADQFSNFSTLSSLDLSVEVERSVTMLAAQIATEATGQATLPTEEPNATAVRAAIPGAAPSAVAAIPPPPSGTLAPTQPAADSVATGDTTDLRPAAPVSQDKSPASLIDQVVDQILDALKDSNVEPHKLRRHLPNLLDRVREEFQKELHSQVDGQGTQPSDGTVRTGSAIFLAYQSFAQTSWMLSVRT